MSVCCQVGKLGREEEDWEASVSNLVVEFEFLAESHQFAVA